MGTHSSETIQAVFRTARDLTDPVQRRRFLDKACGADKALRDRVDSMLREQGIREERKVFEQVHSHSKAGNTQTELNRAEHATFGDPIPKKIGRFKIQSKLGQGGFGMVYLALDEDLNRSVAIKVPHRRLLNRSKDIEFFLTEARALAKLDHPHVISILEFGRLPGGECYLVEKYVPGGSLSQEMAAGRLSPQRSAEIGLRVARALHYIHTRGLVHRDVKPGNILLDEQGRPMLTDFGVALSREQFGQLSRQAGSLSYMSPEQARHEGHLVDGRSDVFSLGVVLYEMLTGQRPFPGRTAEEILDRIKTLDPTPPRQIDDTIPPELERICLRALSKRATERFNTAMDMADDLEQCLESRGVVPLLPSSSAPLGTPSPDSIHHPEGDELEMVIPKGLRSFDADDASFFLELLPGPRGRDGLPETIRFWKKRIENDSVLPGFRIGLLYGPSGCGKSSLLKAGLIPRLTSGIRTVIVEATPAETETRILQRVRQQVSGLENVHDLVQALTRIRQGDAGWEWTRVLICIDQFEQWLQSHHDPDGTTMVEALRQCDGRRLCCLITVRDDFWMAVTRFFQALEVRLVENENSMVFDLFNKRHARKVLQAFGQAYGTVRKAPEGPTESQKRFIARSVSQLADGENIVPARLAMFGEVVKGREWSLATLRLLGGARGVGVKFLEETFSGDRAPPEYRVHQKAIRGVLKSLLPSSLTGLRGKHRSREELLQASGYERDNDAFHRLIEILDREVRLITPMDPTIPEDESRDGAGFMGNGFQLTHDELVLPIREWLEQKERETLRGRASLLLHEQAEFWSVSRKKKNLPSLFQYLFALIFTRLGHWTANQRAMMKAATRLHAMRTVVVLSLLLVALPGPHLWNEWRIHRMVRQATEKWQSGATAWTEACHLLEKAYRLRPSHPDVEALLDRLARHGTLVIECDRADASILIHTLPDEGAKTGLNLSPELLDSSGAWLSGQKISLTPGHYWVTVNSKERSLEFPVFISQVSYEDAGEDWVLSRRMNPERVEPWTPSGGKELSTVRLAEEQLIRPVVPESWPTGYRYVPPGPFWSNRILSREGEPVAGNADLDPPVAIHRIRDTQLRSEYLDQGFLIGVSEVSVEDFEDWYRRTRDNWLEWRTELQAQTLRRQWIGVPPELLDQVWTNQLPVSGRDLSAVDWAREASLRISAESISQDGFVQHDQRFAKELAHRLEEPRRWPMRKLVHHYALDYARTHAAIEADPFRNWLSNEIDHGRHLTSRLAELRDRMRTGDELVSMETIPGDIRIPHFDANFHEYYDRDLFQEYHDWLNYDIDYAVQIPMKSIQAWAAGSRSRRIPESRQQVEMLEGWIDGHPQGRLSTEFPEGNDLVDEYAMAFQIQSWRVQGNTGLLPTDPLDSQNDVLVESRHFAMWLDHEWAESRSRLAELESLLQTVEGRNGMVDTGEVPWAVQIEFGQDSGWGLPTQYQWEKAFRGVDVRRFPWGNDAGFKNVAGVIGTPWKVDVSNAAEDVSPYGVVNLAGNVSEWIAMPPELENAREQPRRCLMGGNYFNPESLAESGSVLFVYGYTWLDTVGFRVARTLFP